MVNKPQCLYHEDALRKAEQDRQTSRNEMRSRYYDELAADTTSPDDHSLAFPRASPGLRYTQQQAHSTSFQAEQMLSLLRSHHASAEARNADRERRINHTIQESPGPDDLLRTSSTGSITPTVPEWITSNRSSTTLPLNPFRSRLMGPSSHAMVRQHQTTEIGAILRGRSIISDLPEVLYAHVETGFFFECYTSRSEFGSYISYELYNQIRPRPEIVPSNIGRHAPGVGTTDEPERLRFNGESYVNLGFTTFSMKMSAPDGDDSKQIDMMITASVVPDLYPDMMLGADQRLEALRDFIM